jgi:hypothetical protein
MSRNSINTPSQLEAHKAYCEVTEKIFGEFFNNGDENE